MKKNVLLISDNIKSTSGVALQSLYLTQGLIDTGKYNITQIGVVVNGLNKTEIINENLKIIYNVGFPSGNQVLEYVSTNHVDAIILVNDPRFFSSIFDREQSIREFCPIIYWHVWDNMPTPRFNDYIYDSVDQINCHSYLTYEMCKENFSDKTEFIPHSIPQSVLYPMKRKDILSNRETILGEEKNKFVVLWTNRNILRKRGADLLFSWKKFLDRTEEKDAVLIMHTDVNNPSGYNLEEIAKYLRISENVKFSVDKLNNSLINVLYNISDATINISHAEGFGLNILEGLCCKKPGIAMVTGGLKRQIVNHRDGTENGVAIYPDVSVINGNQEVHYIYEDFASHENISNSIFKLYDIWKNKKEEYEMLCEKSYKYALEEFAYDKMIKDWDDSIEKTIIRWKNKTKYRVTKI
jgi:glycosyltransferase involved in cell wall biosynthesis